MSENPGDPHPDPDRDSRPPMEINLDRPRRLRSLILYTICLLGVGSLFAWLLTRFTGSRLIGFGLAFGMLAYMLIVARSASRNLRGPGE